jgi:methionyl-tRNA formyltransferase
MLIWYATSENSRGRDTFPNWCRTHNIEILEIFSNQDLSRLDNHTPDLLISDRFSSIFEKYWLEKNDFPKLNVHPSLLPLHRGSFPIFWSALLKSEWGVTVHEIWSGIDDGPIVKQLQIPYEETWTFRDLYELYRLSTQDLLQNIIEELASGRGYTSRAQPEIKGKVHKKKQSLPLIERLRRGWDTPIITARTDLAKDIEIYLRD